MVSKLAVLGLINQKSAMWLVQKEKVSTPLRSSSTVLPLPKSTYVHAPNLASQLL